MSGKRKQGGSDGSSSSLSSSPLSSSTSSSSLPSFTSPMFMSSPAYYASLSSTSPSPAKSASESPLTDWDAGSVDALSDNQDGASSSLQPIQGSAAKKKKTNARVVSCTSFEGKTWQLLVCVVSWSLVQSSGQSYGKVALEDAVLDAYTRTCKLLCSRKAGTVCLLMNELNVNEYISYIFTYPLSIYNPSRLYIFS